MWTQNCFTLRENTIKETFSIPSGFGTSHGTLSLWCAAAALLILLHAICSAQSHRFGHSSCAVRSSTFVPPSYEARKCTHRAAASARTVLTVHTSYTSLTRCPLRLSPWWSWSAAWWRCCAAPAASAGRVCGSPPSGRRVSAAKS